MTSRNNAQQTGLYSGGYLDLVDGSHFTVSSGVGYIVNTTTKLATKITWNDIVNVSAITYEQADITISVAITSGGTIIQQIDKFTNIQRSQVIIIGEIFIHPTLRTLVDVAYIPVFSWDTPALVDRYVTEPDKIISGNNIEPNGSNMMLNATSGQLLGYSINAKQSMLSPNISNQINITGITYFPTININGEWIYTGNTNLIDSSTWSDGTFPLESASNNKFNLRVLFRSNGIGDVFFLVYPIQTAQYGSITEAESDILKISLPFPKELVGISVPVAWIIVKGNAASIQSATDAKIIPIKNVTSSAGSVTMLATDVVFNNSASTNLTSTNVNAVIDEVNNKIENLDFASSNQFMTANSGVSGTYLATNTLVINPPYSRVKVYVNGLEVEVGDAVKTTDCYFSSDNGTTAKAWGAVAVNDKLYWNGSIAPYQLEATDKITYEYLTRL